MGDGQTGALLRRMEGYVRLMTWVIGGWQGVCICLGVRSIERPDVLSEKINFSAPRGPKSAKFDPGHLDPIYFEVGNFLASPDPPYISKNAQMC